MFIKFATRILNPTIQNLFIELLNKNNNEIKRIYKKQDRKLKLEIKFTVGAVFDLLSLDRLINLVKKEEQKKKMKRQFSRRKKILKKILKFSLSDDYFANVNKLRNLISII
jgi:hypothetical protein